MSQDPTAAIARWIDENFEPESVTITDFPAFPYGKLLTDRQGQSMVVYWDILYGKVAYTFPDDKQ
jgi:hypothetical protein